MPLSRRLAVIGTIVMLSLTLLVALSAPAGAQECDRTCEENGEARVGHSGIRVRLQGDGSVGVRSGDSDCVYSTGSAGLPVGNPGDDNDDRFIFDAVVNVYVVWDCDGDGLTDGPGVFVELADLNALALAARDEIPWPELEIMTTPEEEGKVISGFDIPLRLIGPADFETTFEASADDNGVIVTATGTAELVTWDTGAINAFFGHPEEDAIECDTFGEFEIEDNPCTVYWRTSSAGQPGNRVTLTATILYDVEYTTNLAPGAFAIGPPEFELVFDRPDFPVAEWQAINVAG